MPYITDESITAYLNGRVDGVAGVTPLGIQTRVKQSGLTEHNKKPTKNSLLARASAVLLSPASDATRELQLALSGGDHETAEERLQRNSPSQDSEPSFRLLHYFLLRWNTASGSYERQFLLQRMAACGRLMEQYGVERVEHFLKKGVLVVKSRKKRLLLDLSAVAAKQVLMRRTPEAPKTYSYEKLYEFWHKVSGRGSGLPNVKIRVNGAQDERTLEVIVLSDGHEVLRILYLFEANSMALKWHYPRSGLIGPEAMLAYSGNIDSFDSSLGLEGDWLDSADRAFHMLCWHHWPYR